MTRQVNKTNYSNKHKCDKIWALINVNIMSITFHIKTQELKFQIGQ